MDDIVYVAFGVVLAFPILYLANKVLGSAKPEQKKEERIGYISSLTKTFDTLLEASYNKNTAKYDELYMKLSEKEQGIFKRYMESKLKKGEEREQPVDPNEITKWDVLKWFIKLMFEAGIVTLVAYSLYVYLKR